VFGSQVIVIGPASCVAALQEEPPFVGEMCPTDSWHVARVQLVLGYEQWLAD